MAIPVLFVGGVLFIHWIIPSPPLVISEETTRITGPLTDRGYVDYFKALEERFYPPELATDENGYRDFVRLFGDVREYKEHTDREFYRLQIYEKLGLDPDIPPTMVIPDSPEKIIDFYRAQGMSGLQPLRPVQGGDPWTLEKYPFLADWVNEIDEPLDAIAEALRKPVFYPPLLLTPEAAQSAVPPLLYAILLPETSRTYLFFRNIMQNYQARAGYRLAQGDIDGAIDDTISIMRLGRHMAQTGMLVQYLIGIAIEETARAIPIGANPEYPLAEQQIRRFLAELDALPPHRPLVDVIEWDRYVSLNAIQWLMLGSSLGVTVPDQVSEYTGYDIPHLLFLQTFNWNVAFRRINEMYDAAQEPPPRTKLASILDAIDEQPNGVAMIARALVSFLIPGGKDTFMADVLTGFFAPVTANQIERAQQYGCAENMQQLALAIMLYQLEHGEMPGDNWAEQIEPYLAGTPVAGVPAKYFSCPAHPSPEGKTTYALVQYGNAVPGSLMLVELSEPVPLDEAVITVEEVLEGKRWSWWSTSCNRVVLHNGAVQNVRNEEILRRLLGRE